MYGINGITIKDQIGFFKTFQDIILSLHGREKDQG